MDASELLASIALDSPISHELRSVLCGGHAELSNMDTVTLALITNARFVGEVEE